MKSFVSSRISLNVAEHLSVCAATNKQGQFLCGCRGPHIQDHCEIRVRFGIMYRFAQRLAISAAQYGAQTFVPFSMILGQSKLVKN